jgi:hypothetical protein
MIIRAVVANVQSRSLQGLTSLQDKPIFKDSDYEPEWLAIIAQYASTVTLM